MILENFGFYDHGERGGGREGGDVLRQKIIAVCEDA